MRDLREHSGPWAGQWIQRDIRGTMRSVLQFRGNAIGGGGVDRDGAFPISGEVFPMTWEVRILKAYADLHVTYEGVWNGSFIAGHSRIGPWKEQEIGEFELWPEQEEEALPREALELSRATTH